MERVVIVGCPGAGKTTAARRLAAITGLPLIHLDRHYWQPGWVRPDKAAWRAKVEELVGSGSRWIIDGNYGSTLDVRLAAADTLIHLDFSTALCTWRVARRTWASLGRQRGPETPDGCLERFDWPFFRFVLEYRRKQRPRDMQAMATFQGNVQRFTAPAALERFLAELADDQRLMAHTDPSRSPGTGR